MSALRRLSHAFTGDNVPHFVRPENGGRTETEVRRSSAPVPAPLVFGPSTTQTQTHRHSYDAYGSSAPPPPPADPLNDIPVPPLEYEYDEYEEGYESDGYDRQSIAPSIQDVKKRREDEGDRFALMTAHLYQRASAKCWFEADGVVGMGIVSIRMDKGHYKTFPKVNPSEKLADQKMRALMTWESSVAALNPEIAMKISSKVVHAIMSRLHSGAHTVAIDADTRIQVVDKIEDLAGARKHQYAAFVREEDCLVVWSDEVDTIMDSCDALEARMIQYVWVSTAHRPSIAKIAGGDSNDESSMATLTEKEHVDGEDGSHVDGHEKRKMGPDGIFLDAEEDVGIAGWTEDDQPKRHVLLYAPFVTGLAVILNCCFVGLGVRQLVREAMLDGKYLRFLLLLSTPFTFLVAMFFCISFIGQIWQIFGPIAHFHTNSSYYSGQPPVRSTKTRLPNFTVQMPVYKEGLEAVIQPTIESIKKAITTYERQGGTVSILVCEDGMQLWNEAEQELRKSWYDRNNIGWVARPKHGENGYFRKGRFKKASNMNFACALSLRVEAIMDEIRPMPTEEEAPFWVWTQDDENEYYHEALQRALEESGGIAWAAGNIRIGEYILIIDSDTRVPEDCFLDAASELDASPEVAIIQHESDVMLVIGHYFENGIAHFTRRINKAISFCCANGEVAPFVGHNAFLRWSAVQEVSFVDKDDGVTKIWSESHVSEDFDMSLRLQMKGYGLRWATYSKGGFKEGVSLTCDDELNRWQKYAYGCSELLFHPLKDWWKKGPITSLYFTFVHSTIPLHSKISVTAYISSYYAIAIAVGMSTANWVLVGIWSNSLDAFYLESWQVFLTCVIIFSVLGNITSAIFLYRLKEAGLGYSIVDNFKWLLFFFFFFSGMSWHLTTALIAHLISYNITWGATVKEVSVSNFFAEVPAILRRFNMCYLYAFTTMAAMIIMSTSLIPVGFRITTLTAILPCAVQAACHILYPIVLNPWLMMFNF